MAQQNTGCFLVYIVNHFGEVRPQKWWMDKGDLVGGQHYDVLARRLLSAEQEHMTIDELIKMFPAPPVQIDLFNPGEPNVPA